MTAGPDLAHVTLAQLKAARPDLVVQLQREGATAERERVRRLLREPRSIPALTARAMDLANGHLLSE